MITMLARTFVLTCRIQCIQESQLRSLTWVASRPSALLLASTQWTCPRHLPAFAQRSKRRADGRKWWSGDDDQGKLVRASNSADAAFPRAVLTPYNLVVLPELDRVVSTNTSMDYLYNSRGLTYQIWRLFRSQTAQDGLFRSGENRYGQIDPQEARLGPDGSVFVAAATCGIERITN